MQIRNPKTALLLLVAVHVLATLVVRQFVKTYPTSVGALFVGLVFGQANLLGIWAGLATHRWPLRLGGIILGITYLAFQFVGFTPNNSTVFILLVILVTVAVAAVCLPVQRWVARIQYDNLEPPVASVHGLQFSIRGLLLLTSVAGCLLALRQLLHPSSLISTDGAIVAILTLCCIVIGLTATWATLGTSHPLVCSILVVLVGVGAGEGFIRSVGRPRWFWSSVMVWEAVVLLASLFVVRLCGFRLVRLLRRPGSTALPAAAHTPSPKDQPCSPTSAH